MQVAVESTEGLERRLTVELPEEQLASEVDSRLQSMVGTVRVPGFRPGKVPMKVLVRRFGRQVRDEVVGEMIRSSLVDALQTQNLQPAGGPVVDPVESEPGAGLKYTAVFEVFPEIALSPIEDLEIARPVAEVSEADVDKMFETLRRQRRTWSEVERAAAEGDRVIIDFIGTVEGEEFEGGSGEDFAVELGQSRLIPGFEEGLLGVTSGEEKELALEFPADFPAEHLAGKPVTYRVTVKSVEEPVLPEVDAEFIRDFGVEDGDPERFRAEVRANMERQLVDALRARTRERVMAALLERNQVEVPNTLVHEQCHQILHQRRRELARYGLDPQKLELSEATVEPEARRRVQLGLLLREVVRQAELRPDPLRVREEVERMAASFEDPAQVINWFYADPERLSEIEGRVLEEAAIASLLERAKVSEDPISFDALLNPGQTSST